jgi:putative CocE/NonD family hydrolase
LCYTTQPLEQDLEVTGPVNVKLFATSDALDTDFTAKLVDVFPNGYAMNLCDGVIRARFRESLEQPKLLEPGHVYAYEIDLGSTSNVFLKGHRVRLEVSSSNFPRYDRNPNTGHEFGIDSETRIAHQRIHHSQKYPSHLILPIVPRE